MDIIIKASSKRVAVRAEQLLGNVLFHFIHTGVGPINDADLALQRAFNCAIVYFETEENIIDFVSTCNTHFVNCIQHFMTERK